jgi:hypothetical protein
MGMEDYALERGFNGGFSGAFDFAGTGGFFFGGSGGLMALLA